MPKKRAIVTLTVGERYSCLFKMHCEQSWEKYAQKYGYDVIVFDKPLDRSENAQKRSPAWQKCLILDEPSVKKYEQVVWLDSDIIINSDLSPDICEKIPIDKVGAVDEYSNPTPELYEIVLSRSYEAWEKSGISFVKNLTPQEFYSNWGLPPVFDKVVQTGVMVISPRYHCDVFHHVYYNYEERGGGEWNYEMRPLSYELMKENIVKWLDYRFNMLWLYQQYLHYPFLVKRSRDDNLSFYERILKGLCGHQKAKLLRDAVNVTFRNSYFLHFAGCSDKMRLIDNPTGSSVT